MFWCICGQFTVPCFLRWILLRTRVYCFGWIGYHLPEDRLPPLDQSPEEVGEGADDAGMVGVVDADGLLHAVGQVPSVWRRSGRVPQLDVALECEELREGAAEQCVP